MRLMFVLAAPAIAIMFLAEFGLAIVSRFAPQLQVFILAMPIKSALALMILIFYFATMFQVAYKNSSSFEPYVPPALCHHGGRRRRGTNHHLAQGADHSGDGRQGP